MEVYGIVVCGRMMNPSQTILKKKLQLLIQKPLKTILKKKSTTPDTETPKDDSEETVKDKINAKKQKEVSEKETVKTDFKGCKKIITDAIKLANDGNSMEDAYEDKSDDKILEIEGCLGKYYNNFEKIGFMKKGKGVSLLKRLWDIKVKKDIDGGKMGEKYQIMVNNRSRGDN